MSMQASANLRLHFFFFNIVIVFWCKSDFQGRELLTVRKINSQIETSFECNKPEMKLYNIIQTKPHRHFFPVSLFSLLCFFCPYNINPMRTTCQLVKRNIVLFIEPIRVGVRKTWWCIIF